MGQDKGKTIQILNDIMNDDILNDDELDGTGDTSFSVPPTLIVGAISLNIPWFINPAKDKHFVNALEEYN